MKQPKKRWAWSARQCRRQSLYSSPDYRNQQPPKWYVRYKWHQYRSRTHVALQQFLEGTDETAVHFPGHHRHDAHWF